MAAKTRTYSKRDLERLWVNAGGPKAQAATAAAVALAESGGQPGAYNSSGASGLWQILGTVVPGDVFDPQVNAQNAVKKYKDAGNSFSPWVAYTNGAYKSFAPGESAGGSSKFTPAEEKKLKEMGLNKQQIKEFGGEIDDALKFSPAGIPVQQGIEDAIDPMKAIGAFFTDAAKLLFTPEGWLQVGQIGGGVILIGWGLAHLIHAASGAGPAHPVRFARKAVVKV